MGSEQSIVVKVDSDLKEIMPTFLENRKKDIGALKGLQESNDFKAIEVIGHKLAGNAGSYGLSDLGDIGVSLEEAAGKEDVAAIGLNCQKYQTYMENLVVEYE
ncbi:MAG: Hpt domain-containing protein [Halobacteriovoraceae bacterium]|jgi:HPt (histidine-containing phosphotransfer) domain-containing protein|nr:Hpt domain-containing protein [Halobacteriovoraceae bacterium]